MVQTRSVQRWVAEDRWDRESLQAISAWPWRRAGPEGELSERHPEITMARPADLAAPRTVTVHVREPQSVYLQMSDRERLG